MISLKGKKALVTGGSRGLGKATAIALANEGVNIAVTGRNEASLKETVDELAKLGVQTVYAVMDVADQTSVNAGIAKLADAFGYFDILINNAGIASFGTVLEMDTTEWENMFKVNVFGAYYVTKAVLPVMLQHTPGDIINVASTAGLKGSANSSAYSASKSALIGFSESLFAELRKQDIRVTTLTPSTIATDMTTKDLKITDGNPEKVLQPEDFAQLVVDILRFNRRALISSASIFSSNP